MFSEFVLSTSILAQQNLNLPYDPLKIAPGHSQLTSVLAGFALTGLFLLIERYQDYRKEADEKRANHMARGMYLLFVSFIIGAISSFLYSSMTGDVLSRAYIGFLLASSLFEVHVVVLLLGMIYVFGAFQKNTEDEEKDRKKTELNLSQMGFIGYLGVLAMLLLRVWSDTTNASLQFMQTPDWIWRATFVLVFTPFTLAIFGRLLWPTLYSDTGTFKTYTYVVLGFGIFAAIVQGAVNVMPEAIIINQTPPILFSFLGFMISILASWGIILTPHFQTVENETPQ